MKIDLYLVRSDRLLIHPLLLEPDLPVEESRDMIDATVWPIEPDQTIDNPDTSLVDEGNQMEHDLYGGAYSKEIDIERQSYSAIVTEQRRSSLSTTSVHDKNLTKKRMSYIASM